LQSFALVGFPRVNKVFVATKGAAAPPSWNGESAANLKNKTLSLSFMLRGGKKITLFSIEVGQRGECNAMRKILIAASHRVKSGQCKREFAPKD
jgi:hypothetical protein